MAKDNIPTATEGRTTSSDENVLISAKWIRDNYSPQFKAIDDFDEKANKVPERIEVDSAEYDYWQDFLAEGVKASKELEELRQAVKGPYLAAINTIDATFKAATTRDYEKPGQFEKARNVVAKVLQDTLERKAAEQRERERQIAEKAERERQEALRLEREAQARAKAIRDEQERVRREEEAKQREAAAARQRAIDEAERLAREAAEAKRKATEEAARLAREAVEAKGKKAREAAAAAAKVAKDAADAEAARVAAAAKAAREAAAKAEREEKARAATAEFERQEREKREREEQAAEEKRAADARIAQEAAEQENLRAMDTVNARSADLSRTRSDKSTGSLGDTLAFEIEDIDELESKHLWPLVEAAAKSKAITAFQKAKMPKKRSEVGADGLKQPLKGVRFFWKTKAQFRS